jgi:trehalose 6-phosphate phosphatase
VPIGSQDVEAVLARLAAAPGVTGLFSDFDGTLSPIVAEPDRAGPLPGAGTVLRRLARRFAVVALVSGRPAEWLGARFGAEATEGLELYGLHGLERWTPTGARPVEAAGGWARVVSGLVRQAEDAQIPGLVVENKVLGLTLHWRTADDPARTEPAALELAGRLGRESGMLTRAGKASVELVPPLGVDKGSVVRERGSGLACAAYLGDDVSDLPAFDALDDLARSGAETWRVAVSGPEAPASVIERADLVLGSPEECLRFLRRLAEAAEAPADH